MRRPIVLLAVSLIAVGCAAPRSIVEVSRAYQAAIGESREYFASEQKDYESFFKDLHRAVEHLRESRSALERRTADLTNWTELLADGADDPSVINRFSIELTLRKSAESLVRGGRGVAEPDVVRIRTDFTSVYSQLLALSERLATNQKAVQAYLEHPLRNRRSAELFREGRDLVELGREAYDGAKKAVEEARKAYDEGKKIERR